MNVRYAKTEDYGEILEIYEYAREYMRQSGNPDQWGLDYPQKEIVLDDIAQNHLFVIEKDNVIHGVFAFIIGEDATYDNIEDGCWLSDSTYGTIHRVAGDGRLKGIFNKTVEFCSEEISHLRIDTHIKNKVMQHLIIKNGFTRCGVIYIGDGTPRIAYEKII